MFFVRLSESWIASTLTIWAMFAIFRAVGIFMEDVEAEGSDESITQCVLLVQMSGDWYPVPHPTRFPIRQA